jgi:MFS family permease
MKLNNEYAKVKNLESPRRHPLFTQHNESMQTISQPLAGKSSTTSLQYSNLVPQLSGSSYIPSSMDKARAVALFSICTILLFADQNLMSPNLTAIAKEFNFDDEQRDKKLGGEIALAFFVLGAPASYLVGCLGDAYNRTKLFAATVCIGELGCILTYWVQTYSQLYVCRAITGFSVGGALPLIYSILGDLFPSDERHRVGALVGIGTGAGISLGQCIAGFLGPTFGWRLPFLVIGVPAVFCALAVWLFVPDPERGAMEEAVRQRNRNNQSEEDQDVESGSPFVEMVSLEERVDQNTQDEDIVAISSHDPKLNWMGFWATFMSIISTPTVRLALLQGGPGCVPWGKLLSIAPPWFVVLISVSRFALR